MKSDVYSYHQGLLGLLEKKAIIFKRLYSGISLKRTWCKADNPIISFSFKFFFYNGVFILGIYTRLTETSSMAYCQSRIGGHQGYGKVDLPKVKIMWYLALAGNWTPVAEFASYIEYHYTTDPTSNPFFFYRFVHRFTQEHLNIKIWCFNRPFKFCWKKAFCRRTTVSRNNSLVRRKISLLSLFNMI